MATELLYPTAQGDQTTWILHAGSDKVTAVQTNDGDTSCIRRGGLVANLYQDYTVDLSGLSSLDTINSVSIGGYLKNNTGVGNRVNYSLNLPGGRYNYSSSFGTDTSWTLYKKTWTTNPDTSSAWVLDDIDGTNKFQIGIYNVTTAVIYYCTQIFAEIDYTPGGASGPLVDGGLAHAGLVDGRLVR